MSKWDWNDIKRKIGGGLEKKVRVELDKQKAKFRIELINKHLPKLEDALVQVVREQANGRLSMAECKQIAEAVSEQVLKMYDKVM